MNLRTSVLPFSILLPYEEALYSQTICQFFKIREHPLKLKHPLKTDGFSTFMKGDMVGPRVPSMFLFATPFTWGVWHSPLEGCTETGAGVFFFIERIKSSSCISFGRPSAVSFSCEGGCAVPGFSSRPEQLEMLLKSTRERNKSVGLSN